MPFIPDNMEFRYRIIRQDDTVYAAYAALPYPDVYIPAWW